MNPVTKKFKLKLKRFIPLEVIGVDCIQNIYGYLTEFDRWVGFACTSKGIREALTHRYSKIFEHIRDFRMATFNMKKQYILNDLKQLTKTDTIFFSAVKTCCFWEDCKKYFQESSLCHNVINLIEAMPNLEELTLCNVLQRHSIKKNERDTNFPNRIKDLLYKISNHTYKNRKTKKQLHIKLMINNLTKFDYLMVSLQFLNAINTAGIYSRSPKSPTESIYFSYDSVYEGGKCYNCGYLSTCNVEFLGCQICQHKLCWGCQIALGIDEQPDQIKCCHCHKWIRPVFVHNNNGNIRSDIEKTIQCGNVICEHFTAFCPKSKFYDRSELNDMEISCCCCKGLKRVNKKEYRSMIKCTSCHRQFCGKCLDGDVFYGFEFNKKSENCTHTKLYCYICSYKHIKSMKKWEYSSNKKYCSFCDCECCNRRIVGMAKEKCEDCRGIFCKQCFSYAGVRCLDCQNSRKPQEDETDIMI